MQKFDPDTEEYSPDQRRPLGLALLSAVFFGGLGAAAFNWLAHTTVPTIDRVQHSIGAKWATIIGGTFSAVVAFHGARHVPKDQLEKHDAKVAHAPSQGLIASDPSTPVNAVNAKDAEISAVIAQQNKNLGL